MQQLGNRQSMWPTTNVKPPFDWSYDTAVSIRSSMAQTLPAITSEPTFIQGQTITSYIGPQYYPLWSIKGCVGMLVKDSSSSTNVQYKIYDTISNTISETLATIPIGSSSNVNVRMCPTIDGKLMIASRYQGKVWIIDEDGSNLQYLGQTNASFSTNFGIRIYNNYDGTYLVFGEDATNGPSYIVNNDLTISSGASMNSTYPYAYIKLPGKAIVTGSTGVVSIFDESMATRLLSNRTVSSYCCMNRKIFVPPIVGEVTWGLCTRSNVMGIKLDSPYSNVTTNVTKTNVNNGGSQIFLPTGQMFGKADQQNQDNSNKLFLFNYLSNTITWLSIAPSSLAPPVLLPTGKIITRITNDTNNYTFCQYDFGINANCCPINLCNGPFGFNNIYI